MLPKAVTAAAILIALTIFAASISVSTVDRDPVFRQALNETDGDIIGALKKVGYVTCNDDGKPVYVALNRSIRRNRKTMYMNNEILSYLKEYDTIKSLIIGTKTNINDAGMAHIAELKNLEFLNIRMIPITRSGLSELKSLDKLQWLSVNRTYLSDEDLLEFQDAMPNCLVQSDGS